MTCCGVRGSVAPALESDCTTRKQSPMDVAVVAGSAVQQTSASPPAFSLAAVSAIFSDDATITGGTGGGMLPIEFTGSVDGVLFPTWNYPQIPAAMLPGCSFGSPNDALCYLPFTYGEPVAVDLSAEFQTSFNGNVWESGDWQESIKVEPAAGMNISLG